MRVYRWLLRRCPEALWREYGAAMEETFAQRMAQARTAGGWRRAQVWWREVAGLVVLAISEQWGRAARLRRHRQRMLAAPKAGIMDTMAQEIRQAARRLVRTPVFTLAAVATLALAIAANAAIFTLVHRIVINPLPFPDSARLLSLDYGIPARNVPSGLGAMSWQLYYQLADNARSIELAAFQPGAAVLTGNGTPERLVVTRATPSLASVLRVSPARGRWFTDDEGETGTPPVAVLSHGFWVRRFGADPAIVGRTVALNGLPTAIVGVMPASFAFPQAQVDLWMPAQSTRASASFLFMLAGIARLRDDATVTTARAEITQLIADLARAAPNQQGIVSTALPLQEAVVGRIAGGLWILLASVGLVLLVACANIANLFLVRSESRLREVAVRQALGAGTRRLARFFLTESVLLGLAGGVVGLLLAWGAVRLLVAFGPPNLPRLNEVRLDWVVVAFTAGLSLLAAMAFGAIPLFRLTPLPTALHDNGRGQTASRSQHRARHLLMGGQVALALMLLVAAGLMVRSVQKLRVVDLGFDPASTLSFSVGLPPGKYNNRERAVDTHRAILERISAIPGVVATSAATCLPLSGGCFGNILLVEGEALDEAAFARPWASFRGVAAGYLEAAGLRLQRGRTLSRGDIDRREPVVVIDRAFADVYFPGADPIGRRIRSGAPPTSPLAAPPWLEIVGVVSSTPTQAITEPVRGPQLYMPMSIAGGPDIPAQTLIGPDVSIMSYVVRSSTPPEDLTAAARAAVASVDPDLAMAQVRTLQDIVDRASDQMLFTMVLLGIAAAVALLLGAIGIYGVVSYIAAQRTGEIGLRLALGAEPGGVAAMILRQNATVTLIGIVVGLFGALAGGRLIEALLYNVSPRDPLVIGAMTLLLSAIALFACWLPAWRAARLSPLEALRGD